MFRTRRRVFVYVFLFLLLLINYMDRINLSVAGAPVAKDLGLSPVSLGYLFSSFLWVYILCLLPAGSLTDRLGSRTMMAVAIGLWSTAQALTGMAGGFASMLLARLGLGLAESPTNAAANRAIREWAPSTERGVATSAFIAGSYAGPAVGAPLVAWLITVFGWRESFIVTGLLGFVWLAMWLMFFRTPETTSWISEAERSTILNERESGGPRVPVAQLNYLTLLRARSMWGIMLTQGCLTYTQYLFLSWLPNYLQTARGVPMLQSGLYTAVPYLVAVVGSLLISRFSDWRLRGTVLYRGARRLEVAMVTIASSVVLLAPYVDSLLLVMVLFTISLTFSASAVALNFTLLSDLLRTPENSGRCFALLTIGGNSLAITAPIVTGYIVQATGRFDIAFIVAGLLSLLGAGIVTVMTRNPIGEPAVVEAKLVAA
jgi:MFS family permease